MLVTVLLIDFQGGWAERVSTVGVGLYGRIEGLLSIGSQPSLTAAYAVADKQLDTTANPLGEITEQVRNADTDQLPFRDYFVGDTITNPDPDLTPIADRVVTNTVTEDESGNVTLTTTTRGIIFTAEEEAMIIIRKMIPGAKVGT